MKYLMLVYGNEEIWSSLDEAGFRALVDEVDAWNADLRASGELLAAEGLVTRPRSVRRLDGQPVVTDGPYLEAKEHVGSYSLLDVASEERAVELLRSYPGVLSAGAELWPLMSPGAEA